MNGNVKIGKVTSDEHEFWGTLKSGSASDLHKIIPYSSWYGYVGTSSNYWYRMYADSYYGKSTSISSFDIFEDDLEVADSIKIKNHTDNKTGKTRQIFDPETIPAEIKDETGEFIDMNALSGFNLSCIRKAHGKIKDQESRIAAQEAKIAEQEAKLARQEEKSAKQDELIAKMNVRMEKIEQIEQTHVATGLVNIEDKETRDDK